MWWKAFKDYPLNRPMKHEQVEPSKGIYGCEMHDLNGWGEEFHRPVRRSKRRFEILCSWLFGYQMKNED